MSKTKFSRSLQEVDIKNKNNSVIIFKKVELPFKDYILKSTKNSLLKIKWKDMRTFHVQVLFQAATENYSIHSAANGDTLTILTPINSCGECSFN